MKEPKRAIGVNELGAELELLLTQPPSKAGMRLCSERELASLLHIDRTRIQKAFDILVERGILVRRHGSGTYVRKVPKAQTEVECSLAIVPERLFAAKKSFRRQIQQAHRKLQFAVIPNQTWESASNRATFEGIEDRVLREGHHLKILSPRGKKEGRAKELIDAMRENPSDGYILWTSNASLLQEAFPDDLPPAVFIGAGERSTDLDYSPVARVDLEDGILRSLGILAREGFRRIAFIGLESVERDQDGDRAIYDDGMRRLGLDYRASVFCPLNLTQCRAAMRALFSGDERPDAVYMADDVVLQYVLPAWKKLGLVPGQNLGVITLSTRSSELPGEFEWSRMEFNPFQLGRMAVDSLLREIETAGEELCSFEHLGQWREGKTHQRANVS